METLLLLLIAVPIGAAALAFLLRHGAARRAIVLLNSVVLVAASVALTSWGGREVSLGSAGLLADGPKYLSLALGVLFLFYAIQLRHRIAMPLAAVP